jgi:hypothetical protein
MVFEGGQGTKVGIGNKYKVIESTGGVNGLNGVKIGVTQGMLKVGYAI